MTTEANRGGVDPQLSPLTAAALDEHLAGSPELALRGQLQEVSAGLNPGVLETVLAQAQATAQPAPLGHADLELHPPSVCLNLPTANAGLPHPWRQLTETQWEITLTDVTPSSPHTSRPLTLDVGSDLVGHRVLVDLTALRNLEVAQHDWETSAALVMQMAVLPWFADVQVVVVGGFSDAADVAGFRYVPTLDALDLSTVPAPTVIVVNTDLRADQVDRLQQACDNGTLLVIGPAVAEAGVDLPEPLFPGQISRSLFESLLLALLRTRTHG